MKRLALLCAAPLLVAASHAFASSFLVTTDAIADALHATSNATSDVTGTFRDDKIVREAKDDAASFVASTGQLRGARLEAAFGHLRAHGIHGDDLALAQAILAI
jgi:uncharacterized protein (TIGR02448 family)